MAHTSIRGRVGRDPELKTSKNGRPYLRISIAWQERTKTPTGWDDGPTIWVNATVYDTQANNLAHTLHKGDRIIAAGNLQPREWQSNEGPKLEWDLNNATIGIECMYATATIHPTPKNHTQNNTNSNNWGTPQPPF